MASLLYKLPKPNFDTHNVYIFEFQVAYVNLYFRQPITQVLKGEFESEEEERALVKEESAEEEEEKEILAESEEYLGEEKTDSEPQISLGGGGEGEGEEDEYWMDIDLEELQINELTTEAEYKAIFMNGIQIKTDMNQLVVSRDVKAILYSLDKINTTREGMKAQIELLNLTTESSNRNETVERDYITFEKSDNSDKHFTEPEGFLDTLDVEDLPLPSMKKLKVSMALYDIKLIQVDEERFLVNLPSEVTEMEEDVDSDIIYKVTDYRLIPVPQCPVNDDDISVYYISKKDLKKKSVYRAITSLRPEQMIDRVKTIPLLIDISEFDRLAMKPMKTLGMSRLGYLGNRFVDVIKTNAVPNASTPNNCIKEAILPITNQYDYVVGEVKVIIKLKCYNKRGWPKYPSKLERTPSLVELLEGEHLIIESIQPETSDISDEVTEDTTAVTTAA